jgi:D-psicose/D-tagatose/L-ribulose 3-epimerase
MKVAVSNIAWEPSDDAAVAAALIAAGVSGIEIAPTKLWAAPEEVGPAEAGAVRDAWAGRGLPIVAMQSLLYGQPDLLVFAGADVRGATRRHLEAIITLGGRLGARRLVFGSPKNRQRGAVPMDDAMGSAAEFFRPLAEHAAACGTVLCIEPNPPQYGSDFVTDAAQAVRLADLVDHEGFGVHLDVACMSLAGDDPAEAIPATAQHLRHFHVSEPELGPVGVEPDGDHTAAAAALVAAGYDGWCSVEMRPATDGDRVAAVERAARFAVGTYGGPEGARA